MNNKNKVLQSLERGKITSIQLSFLLITLVIATADVFLPAFVAQEAGRDSWLSVILGTLIALITVSIILALGLRYPDKTIIQYSSEILGKPIGLLISILYIYFLLENTRGVTRELGELFVIAFNPDAPMFIYNAVVVAVAAYAVLKGLEVIARVNQLLLPIGLGILLFVSMFNIPNMDFNNFLPVLYDGFKPVIRGSFLIKSYLLEVVVVLQLIPFVSKKDKIRRNTLIAVILLGLSLMVGTLTIAVFGPVTKNFLFPALEFVRYAGTGQFFRNLDISIMGVWIAGIFIKISVFYYCSVLALAQLLNFKSYKPLIIPIGALTLCLSMYSPKTLFQALYFMRFIYPFFVMLIAFVLPTLLLTVSLIRGKTPAANKHES